MMFPEDQVAELRALATGGKFYEEGGRAYILLPSLILPDGCVPERLDVLLCPSERDGYPSRLFFAEKVLSRLQRNWNSDGVRIVERNWHAYSWKVPASGLRLAQLLAAHLEALR